MGSVADFKNTKEANYKDTGITSTEAFFVVDFEHVLVCWEIFRNNKFLKITHLNFQEI